MNDNSIMCGSRHDSSYLSLFENIVLGRTEMYDATELNCWGFSKATDVRAGITLSLGNLCSGFPFSFYGHTFQTSEQLYLCGEFSSNTALNEAVQRGLQAEQNAFLAKKVIKRRNAEHIRQDWEDVRLQWMLYVVWHKCSNANFRNLLLSIPNDAVIIEDSTANHGATSSVWGAKNKELMCVRRVLKKELIAHNPTMKKKDLNKLISKECSKITDIGSFVGENNMGKILMMCKIALQNSTVPPIDYDLLREKKIYLFGELLTFDKEEAL